MLKVGIRLKCKKVGLEHIVQIPGKDKYLENLGFIPPIGTTLTLKGFEDSRKNGKYKVINTEGNIDIRPPQKDSLSFYKEKQRVELGFLYDYTIELKKLK